MGFPDPVVYEVDREVMVSGLGGGEGGRPRCRNHQSTTSVESIRVFFFFLQMEP